MKKSTSMLAMIAMGAAFAAAPAAVSTAKETGRRPLELSVRCPHSVIPDDQGFGGFSGGKGHPFPLDKDYGARPYEFNWDKDPFWTPDPYYGGYGDIAYVQKHGSAKQVSRCL